MYAYICIFLDKSHQFDASFLSSDKKLRMSEEFM